MVHLLVLHEEYADNNHVIPLIHVLAAGYVHPSKVVRTDETPGQDEADERNVDLLIGGITA
jgi:hypothetical protein